MYSGKGDQLLAMKRTQGERRPGVALLGIRALETDRYEFALTTRTSMT